MKTTMLSAIALFALLCAASANEFVGGDVVHLTSSNYDDMVRVCCVGGS